MPVARFRFYAELNDFLSPDRRFAEFEYDFLDIATVKDRIESFGVPHVEVDLILVNGQSVDFSHPVQDGDRKAHWRLCRLRRRSHHPAKAWRARYAQQHATADDR